MSRILKRLTYANVIATIALFIALGGASYAAFKLPKGSVGTRQLKREAVTPAKVKAGSLPASVLAPGTLPNVSNLASKTEVKGRLGSTVVVNKTIGAVAANNFTTGSVTCPAGYQAIAGGVDPSNVFFAKVSVSAPTIEGKEPAQQPDGQSGPATGWFGAVTTQGAPTGAEVAKIQVICAPLG